MADVTLDPIPVPQPQSISTFDFVDIESGVGYVRYLGYSTETDGGLSYSIDNFANHSSQIETVFTGLTTSFVKVMDLDFDTSVFSLPRSIQGVGSFQFTIGHKYTAGNIYTTFAVIKVRTWDGTTETEIADARIKDIIDTPGVGIEFISDSFTLPLTIPQTLIKKGELLRVTMEVWAKVSTINPTAQTALTHSPFDEDGTVIIPSSQDSKYTQLIMQMPFKIQT